MFNKIIIAGSGLTGLTLALLLAKKGVKVILLDEKNEVGKGSKAICFSRRTLEIFDKLGIAKLVLEQGVQWNKGRVFFRNKEIYSFELLPDKSARYPAFVNISQYEVEKILIAAVNQEKNIELRRQHRIDNLTQDSGGSYIKVTTPIGEQTFSTAFLVACDGSRSTVRRLMGLKMIGSRSEEKFLIIDFRMEADFPSERWFWFAPLHHEHETILLHKQPDNIWRLDVKLGRGVSEDIVNNHDFVLKKIKQVVGDKPVKVEWVSLYRFSNKMLENFVFGQVIFAGDAAHVFSPFGARGANSGIHDADNLAWKLSEILQNNATTDLLKTYNHERVMACNQNITCTTNSTLFISPPSLEAIAVRDSILQNAIDDDEAKRKVNCGRLSVPNIYSKYLSSEQGEWLSKDTSPGYGVKDCLMREGYLIEKLGYEFTLIIYADIVSPDMQAYLGTHDIQILPVNSSDNPSLISLYELTPTSAYLITPDQYILGRWKEFTPEKAIQLKQTYLSGALDNITPPILTEQELIDEKVAKSLINAT
ncbi:FAD-dependent monooxygenase [Emticicia sp. BO119]|uniref:FAD-dependent monooxygenase n=1 Tax=Emticicia sp. BO119 TaxID=2757768 RepID=UPI0015F0E964|nr:FAD-dependent monooxygenase [Emticicia sp. BO119]MBA4849361.1 FAD-dependent monooxygenase [Emticicia sp. BO119]